MSGWGLLVEHEGEGDQERNVLFGRNPAPVKQIRLFSHFYAFFADVMHPYNTSPMV